MAGTSLGTRADGLALPRGGSVDGSPVSAPQGPTPGPAGHAALMHLGVTVYHWGTRPQNRLLVECLGPAAETLRRRGLATHFWFDRSDIRGPHLFCLFTTSRATSARLSRVLSARLDEYLSAFPSQEHLSPAELAARHDECRGAILCLPHAKPGIADNNTYRLFEHDPGGYPFSLSAGLPSPEEFWDLVDDLTGWTIRQLASDRATEAAIRWIAAVDHALRRTSPRAEDCWRHHAISLLPALERSLAQGEEAVHAALPSAVGEKNYPLFTGIWDETGERPACWGPIDRLLKVVLAGGGWPAERSWVLLREVKHVALKQLGLAVALHLPLILFAWHRSRRAAGSGRWP